MKVSQEQSMSVAVNYSIRTISEVMRKKEATHVSSYIFN
jgi:hypothetical protein